MKFDKNALASAMIAKRTADNTSFRSLCALIEVDKQTLHRAEIGVISNVEAYAKICQWLGVKMDKFFTFKK